MFPQSSSETMESHASVKYIQLYCFPVLVYQRRCTHHTGISSGWLCLRIMLLSITVGLSVSASLEVPLMEIRQIYSSSPQVSLDESRPSRIRFLASILSERQLCNAHMHESIQDSHESVSAEYKSLILNDLINNNNKKALLFPFAEV